MMMNSKKSFRFGIKCHFIILIMLNLVLTPRSEDIQAQNGIDSNNASGDNLSSTNETTSSSIFEGDHDNEVEVEIEEVDNDGGSTTGTSSGPFSESSKTNPTSKDGTQEESNKNSADPTAVAKVYDDAVPNYIAGTGATSDDKAGKGANAKPNRIKVSCWDYRTMGVFNASTYNVNATENATSVEAEATEESLSSTEESETVTTTMNPQDTTEGDLSTEADEGQVSPVIDTSNRTVELVNMTTLLYDILYSNPLLKRSTAANCTVVMFYAPWCPFSAKAAPHYNALPRGYPPLRVTAIDSFKFKNVNTYFGILSVPTVVLFHNGKVIAKFNDTSFTLAKFTEFIEYFTDLKHEDRMNVTTKDFEGPLPSVATKEFDWYLYVAWVFIIFCFFHYVSKSVLWRRAVDFVSTAWREAEAQHEHID